MKARNLDEFKILYESNKLNPEEFSPEGFSMLISKLLIIYHRRMKKSVGIKDYHNYQLNFREE